MASNANNMFTGAAGAGRMARRALVARAAAQGKALPTFRKLRS